MIKHYKTFLGKQNYVNGIIIKNTKIKQLNQFKFPLHHVTLFVFKTTVYLDSSLGTRSVYNEIIIIIIKTGPVVNLISKSEVLYYVSRQVRFEGKIN